MSEQGLEKTVVDTPKESGVDYEALASEMGWVPKEKFKGDPAKWTEAQVYYENGEKVLPIVKAQNKDLKAKLDKALKDVEEVKTASREYEKFVRESSERSYNEKVAELEARKAQAIESGDGKEAVKVDRELNALEKPEPKPEPKPQVNPLFESWVAENDWYKTNSEMRDEADAIGIALNKRGLPLEQVMQGVRDKIEKLYPEKFETQERPTPQRPRPSGHNSKAKSYENLPDDAKKACDRFLKNGMIKDKQQFIDNYDWSL